MKKLNFTIIYSRFENYFKEKLQQKSQEELQQILAQRHKYVKGVVDAATEIIEKRNSSTLQGSKDKKIGVSLNEIDKNENEEEQFLMLIKPALCKWDL